MTTVTPATATSFIDYFGLGIFDTSPTQVTASNPGGTFNVLTNSGTISASSVKMTFAGGGVVTFFGSFTISDTTVPGDSAVQMVKITGPGGAGTLVDLNANRLFSDFTDGIASETGFFSNLFKLDDVMTGSNQNDDIAGMAGNDVIRGGAGKDILRGGAGKDQLFGDGGNDTLWAGDGADILKGGTGRDKLNGDRGNDTIRGGDQNDTLNGGAGDDILFGGSGKDKLVGDIGRDTLDGGRGNDKLEGGKGNDVLSGSAGNDTLRGGKSNDTLNGGGGRDTLNGGGGRDILHGGIGVDTMTGGSSRDVFVFNKPNDSGILEPARDTITDFVTGVDQLDFSDLMASLSITGAVVGAFSGLAGQIVLGVSGVVSLDLDGDARADMAINVQDVGLAAAITAFDLIL